MMAKSPKTQIEKVRKLHAAGKKEEARKLCKAIVAQNPDEADAWFLLGQLYHEIKQSDYAIACLDKVADNMSSNLSYHLARGKVELELFRYKQAILSYEKALSINPQEPNAAFGLGVACIWTHEWTRSVSLFRLLSGVWKDNPSVWFNLAFALNYVQDPQKREAEEAAKKVLRLTTDSHPDSQMASLLLLTIYWERREYCKVVDLALQVLTNKIPANTRASAMTMLVRGEAYLSQWRAFNKHSNQVIKIVEGSAHGILAYDLFLNPKAVSRTHLLCATKNAESTVANKGRLLEQPTYNRHYPLRIGFLSSDFRKHVVSSTFVRCFELLCRRERLSVYAYSTANPENSQDPLRIRIKEASDYFVDVSSFSLERLAQKIRDDQIDILVDLNGHTANNRMGVFSYRPARVNVNYLGFPGTTGSRFHDWILGDQFVTPESEEACFSEKIWRLPDTYMPTDDSRILIASPSKAEAGLPDENFIFACFNSNQKITPDVFDVWCEILRKVPDSVLWLRECPNEAQENLVKSARERGIENTRIIFAPWLKSPKDHWGRVALADLSLDTWPYNMHVTCVDTLFAGVPVFTLKGKTFPGRVAESILNAAGLADLVFETREKYIAMAVHLAMNPDRLKSLKNRIRWSQTNSPLFNSARMTNSLEKAFIGIYEQETGIKLQAPA